MRAAFLLTCLPFVTLVAGACSRHASRADAPEGAKLPTAEAPADLPASPRVVPAATATASPTTPLAAASAAAPAVDEARSAHDKSGALAPPAPPAPAAAGRISVLPGSADGFGGGAGMAWGAPLSSRAAGAGMGSPAKRAIGGPSGFIAEAPVRAGEWDDNANYRDFMRYLADEERIPYHRVDLTNRRFLVVRDADGKAVPHCAVTVTDAAEHAVTLTTMASGRALLFPHAEGLDGGPLTATASCGGFASTARFTTEAEDDAVSFRLAGKRMLPATRFVDVAFILDTTGSMSEEIDAVKSTIAKVTRSLGNQNYRARLGLVEYKDRSDPFVTRIHAFSTNPSAFLAGVAGVTAGGGGDYPESVDQGLHDGLTKLDWSGDAVARFAFLIGDAPPHLDYANDSDYAVDMKNAAHRGIQVFTVAASGMDDLGQAVWRQIAQYTGATNLFVLRGGAGPQSTGAGDPKSSCGGTQAQYASGNLDTLITKKILFELDGIDADPMRIAGLYKDESAKPCNERVAMQ